MILKSWRLQYLLFSEVLQTLSWWVFFLTARLESIQQPCLEDTYPYDHCYAGRQQPLPKQGLEVTVEKADSLEKPHAQRKQEITRLKQLFLHKLSFKIHSSVLNSVTVLIPEQLE